MELSLAYPQRYAFISKTSNNQRLANAGEDDSYLFFSVMEDFKAHVEKGFALRG